MPTLTVPTCCSFVNFCLKVVNCWVGWNQAWLEGDLARFPIAMIRWTGLSPWEFEFPFSGSLTSTFLCRMQAWLEGDLARANNDRAAHPWIVVFGELFVY